MGMDMPAPSMKVTKAKLEELKNDKGRLNRQIGEVRKNGGSADKLIEELKRVSADMKALQKVVKQQLNQDRPPDKWTPPTLDVPPAIGQHPTVGPIAVRDCGGHEVADAEAYVLEHPASSIWHRPSVASFIANTYGHRTRFFCAYDEQNSLVGVLPVVQLKSRLFGNFLVSTPYFNYGGVLANSPKIARALIDQANEWRHELGADSLEMRFCQDNALALPQRTGKVTFWLPLPNAAADLWDSFQPKVRAQIRRGERELSGFAIGGVELLDDFYRVFSINMRDLGTPVYGKEFFRNLLHTLQGKAWLAVARINGKPVGCAFLTGYRGRMEIPWASTLRRYNQTGINMVMYWRILEFAITKRFDVFDFGRCNEGAGTYRFKQQWGAQAIPLYWDYVLPEGATLPSLNPNNPKFRILIAAWQRMPVWLANLIGPAIVKVLP